jgi:hypothetical protein
MAAMSRERFSLGKAVWPPIATPVMPHRARINQQRFYESLSLSLLINYDRGAIFFS